MSSRTPLRLLAELLAERNRQPLPSYPPGEEAKALRAFLEKAARTRREREVAAYLERAATGGGAPGTRAGSLKNLLWLLRDRAGELYEDLARALLRR
ncbi:hypothetical protein, partial [Thermoflexus sp.]|uniref:hypothetical protein n=1 Tax=Thermoflexus sp. TaxID=1969742 RepID=UPI002ADE2733